MPLRWWPSAKTLIWFGFGSTKMSRRRRSNYEGKTSHNSHIDLPWILFVVLASQ
jgi:hypothetical protein